MSIRGLRDASITSFSGKNTSNNLAEGAAGTMLSAKNVLVLSDNQVRRAPGYTALPPLPTGPVYSVYDFERNVDGAQFIMVHAGANLYAILSNGTVQIMSTGETSEPFMFVQNAFACYASNGVNAWRFVDVAGTLTKYQWGITTPATAPTIGIGAGPLTLTFGRRYLYSYVAKFTDSLGIQRVSVSAPSPLSAHTGPVTNGTVTLGSLTPSTDPQVTNIWIWATTDSPVDTSATYFFAAEIPGTQTSWGDTLPDASLDQTRVAPFDNNPAPPSAILTTFQNRVVAVQGSQIRLSGYDEIALGVPEESWPLDLFFNIPSGTRKATAAITAAQGSTLLVCTEEAWYAYTGYDASTFTENDRVALPGAAGKFALTITPFGITYTSSSKRHFIWQGNGSPTEISADIALPITGTYSMDDVADPTTVRHLWYSYGRQHFLVVLARTTDTAAPTLNLMQIWSAAVQGSESSGEYTGSSGFFSQISGLYQTDKLPAANFTAAGLVKIAGVPYLYLGDTAGALYRFPDGFTDAGTPSTPTFSTAWMLGKQKNRFYYVDLLVESPPSLDDAGGPLSNYRVFAAVAEAPLLTPKLIPLTLQQVPSPDGVSEYALRASLQLPGLNVGRFLRLWITLPQDSTDHVLQKMTIWSSPMYGAQP